MNYSQIIRCVATLIFEKLKKLRGKRIKKGDVDCYFYRNTNVNKFIIPHNIDLRFYN
jgi:hypothetical protein